MHKWALLSGRHKKLELAINHIKSGLCWCGVCSINNTHDYMI